MMQPQTMMKNGNMIAGSAGALPRVSRRSSRNGRRRRLFTATRISGRLLLCNGRTVALTDGFIHLFSVVGTARGGFGSPDAPSRRGTNHAEIRFCADQPDLPTVERPRHPTRAEARHRALARPGEVGRARRAERDAARDPVGDDAAPPDVGTVERRALAGEVAGDPDASIAALRVARRAVAGRA